MTTTLKSKPQYKTISVTKDNGQVVHIGRCALADLETLMEAQERLVTKYVKSNGAVGKLFLDSEVISDLELSCNLLPIVGSKDNATLSYEEISENWEQLIVLFFNGGFNTETRENDELKPSKVSQLHFLPYMETVAKVLQELKEEAEKEQLTSQK